MKCCTLSKFSNYVTDVFGFTNKERQKSGINIFLFAPRYLGGRILIKSMIWGRILVI
jgi:hypothetical protein